MSRLARDHSGLPKAGVTTRGQGWFPDAESRFGRVLIDAWHAEADDNKPLAHPDARFRHSDGAGCARAVSYAALGIEPTNPMTPADHYVTRLGTEIHDAWQQALQAAYPGTMVEVQVTLDDNQMAGHEDAEVVITTGAEIGTEEHPDAETILVSIEAKSVGGYSYKLAIGERGPAQGPAHHHVVQGSLNGYAQRADEVVILYLAREAISHQAAARAGLESDYARVTAEWTLRPEQFMPIAEREIARVSGILGLLDEGYLAARKIADPELPARHEIVDPSKGAWTALDDKGQLTAGTTWHCTYCRWQDFCDRTRAGRIPVHEVMPDAFPRGFPSA